MNEYPTVLDYIPPVDYRNYPHCFDPEHQPVWTVEDMEGNQLADFGTDIVSAVAYCHHSKNGYVTLIENGIPVFDSFSG